MGARTDVMYSGVVAQREANYLLEDKINKEASDRKKIMKQQQKENFKKIIPAEPVDLTRRIKIDIENYLKNQQYDRFNPEKNFKLGDIKVSFKKNKHYLVESIREISISQKQEIEDIVYEKYSFIILESLEIINKENNDRK